MVHYTRHATDHKHSRYVLPHGCMSQSTESCSTLEDNTAKQAYPSPLSTEAVLPNKVSDERSNAEVCVGCLPETISKDSHNAGMTVAANNPSQQCALAGSDIVLETSQSFQSFHT